MGVPKFYRWLSERYPCLSQVINEHQIPEFDNLYLDMNGIIHACSHPEDSNPHFRITEDKIVTGIFHYIEHLFRLIKPQKVFFMAVDGVAPRAKMNQQRTRRFRSAKEAEDLIRKARQSGQELPKDERFDSNCITPGTGFMDRLDKHLKYFINSKLSTDPGWQNVKIIYSGHQVPGEGEHKIMDYIRYERSQPGYNPNTRHCLYGLDADLILLGLVTHEPHFALLREEVKFGKKANDKRVTSPDQQTFHLLHLSLLRDYIDLEFSCVKPKLGFEYNLERIIDDWVLMGFLVGNDFIPNIPGMHIKQEILPYLYERYTQTLPRLPDYINNGGQLNLKSFEIYLESLAEFDEEQFEVTLADMRWLAGKTGKTEAEVESSDLMEESGLELFEGLDEGAEVSDRLKRDFGIESLQKFFDEADAESEVPAEKEALFVEMRKHKQQYYAEKFQLDMDNKEQFYCKVVEVYVKSIQWILYYYYSGVPSWKFFYPHHYSPYVSDIKGFKDMKIEFEPSVPFLPFEQLLSVLPPASRDHVPKPLQSLMVDRTSPLIDLYPTEFETDLNGKSNDWEAVVLIPFMDEERLLEAIQPLSRYLSEEEKKRNSNSDCVEYSYSRDMVAFIYQSPWPEEFPPVPNCRAKSRPLGEVPFRIEPEQLVKGLCDGVQLDVLFPGFPSLKHVPYTASLQYWGVRVFQQATLRQSMTLTVIREGTDTNTNPLSLKKIASELVGKTCLVGWPHQVEARVISVSDGNTRFVAHFGTYGAFRYFKEETLNSSEVALWRTTAERIKERYHNRRGIDVGPIDMLVEVQELQGRRYEMDRRTKGAVKLVKQYSQESSSYAYQTVIKDACAEVPDTHQNIKSLEDLYPPNTELYLLHPSYYGYQATVECVDLKTQKTSVVVTVTVPRDISLHSILDDRSLNDSYQHLNVVSNKLNIPGQVLTRITSLLHCERGSRENKRERERVAIGLNFKFSKRKQELLGYARLIEEEGWTFSTDAVDIIEEYQKRFPSLFQFLKNNPSDDRYYEKDLFPQDGENGASLDSLKQWLKQLPSYKQTTVACGSEMLNIKQIAAVEKRVDELKKKALLPKVLKSIRVDPKYLFRPLDHMGAVVPDEKVEFYLLDRVINVLPNTAVPAGLCGTITAIYGSESSPTYEVVWDDPFPEAIALRCSPNRGYIVQSCNVINLSHGTQVQLSGSLQLKGYQQDGAVSSKVLPRKTHRDTGQRTKLSSSPSRSIPVVTEGSSIPSISLQAVQEGKIRVLTSKTSTPKNKGSPHTVKKVTSSSDASKVKGHQSSSPSNTQKATKNSKDSAAASEFTGFMKEIEAHSKKTNQASEATQAQKGKPKRYEAQRKVKISKQKSDEKADSYLLDAARQLDNLSLPPPSSASLPSGTTTRPDLSNAVRALFASAATLTLSHPPPPQPRHPTSGAPPLLPYPMPHGPYHPYPPSHLQHPARFPYEWPRGGGYFRDGASRYAPPPRPYWSEGLQYQPPQNQWSPSPPCSVPTKTSTTSSKPLKATATPFIPTSVMRKHGPVKSKLEDKDEQAPARKEDKDEHSPASKEDKDEHSPASKEDKDEHSPASKEDKDEQAPASKEDKDEQAPSSKEDKDEQAPASKEDKDEQAPSSKEDKDEQAPSSKEDKDEQAPSSQEDKVNPEKDHFQSLMDKIVSSGEEVRQKQKEKREDEIKNAKGPTAHTDVTADTPKAQTADVKTELVDIEQQKSLGEASPKPKPLAFPPQDHFKTTGPEDATSQAYLTFLSKEKDPDVLQSLAVNMSQAVISPSAPSLDSSDRDIIESVCSPDPPEEPEVLNQATEETSIGADVQVDGVILVEEDNTEI